MQINNVNKGTAFVISDRTIKNTPKMMQKNDTLEWRKPLITNSVLYLRTPYSII